MTVQGNLAEMSTADLIQHACLDGRTTRITLKRDDQPADLVVYVQAGQLVHAQMGQQVGEQAVYTGLTWKDGTFTLEPDVPAPTRTIDRSYAGVLLEGLHRLDEHAVPSSAAQPSDDRALDTQDANDPAQVAAVLGKISGVEGVVLAARDGVVIAHAMPDNPDKSGAIAVFVGLAAGQAGAVLSLGPLRWATVVTGKDTTLVIERPDYFIGLRLGPQASPALVASQAMQALG